MKRRIDRSYTFSLDDLEEAVIDLLKKRDIPLPSNEAMAMRRVAFRVVGDPTGIEGDDAATMAWSEDIL